MAFGRRHTNTLTVSTSTDGLSDIGAISGMLLVGLQMSTAWTAASATFQGSLSGSTTFHDIYNAGTVHTETVAADQFIVLDPAIFAGVDRIKLRSGTPTTSVAQAAARTVSLSLLAPFNVRI